MAHGEMHWRDGVSFERLENGDVRMRWNDRSPLNGSPTAQVILPAQAVIPAMEWVSIIHHLSKEQSMEAARGFHGIAPPLSAQPCGCDPGEKWTCEQHRVTGDRP